MEVGSYAGQSMKLAMETGLVAEMYCVDPWTPGYDPDDAAAYTDFRAVERMFDEAAAAHPGRVHKFKGDFKAFREANPDVKPDLVYIDAEHTYEGCARDVNTALLAGAALVGGHDYERRWPGVVRAVNERFGRPGLTFSDTSWLCAASAARFAAEESAAESVAARFEEPAKKTSRRKPAAKKPAGKRAAKTTAKKARKTAKKSK